MDRWHVALLLALGLVVGGSALVRPAVANESTVTRCAAWRKAGAFTYVDDKGQPSLDLPPGWTPVGGGPEGDMWIVIACREVPATAPPTAP